jgi:hypothetical protein
MVVQGILPDMRDRIYIKMTTLTSIHKYLMRQTQIFGLLLIW